MTTHRDCFEAAVSAALEGATVLTANTRSARAIGWAAELRLRGSSPAMTGEAWLTPEALPFGAFVERLYSDAVVGGAVSCRALAREQELQLWRHIIERSPGGRDLLLLDSAAALARQAFRTACEYEIALDCAQMSASSDTRAFAGWAAEFRRQLAERRATVPALLPGELSDCLSRLRLPQSICVYLPERTPAQRRFLDALAEAGVAVALLAEGDSSASVADQQLPAEPSSAVRYEFAGAEDELRGGAQWVRRQLEASPGARIGVVILDLEGRAPQVESIFRSELHPEQSLGERGPSVFEIASPRALADYPVVAGALGLLSLVAQPMPFEAFHATLRSPYLAADPDAAARFVAAVRRQARLQVSFDEFCAWVRDSEEVRELHAALGRLPRHHAFASEQPVAYWANIAREILRAFGWPGAAALNSEEFQCTKSWSELFAEIASIEVLGWRCDFAGFVARLERAAAGRNFKPETRNAPVQIMGLAESEGSLFDALWIAGCSDDLWPDSPRLSPLIPAALLKAAGAPAPSTPQDERRIARTTRRLLQSAPRVALSLALRADDDREQRWSPLFAALPPARDPIAIAPSLAGRFTPPAMETICDRAAPPLNESEHVRGGSWLLQDQSNCPFRAFAIRRLLAGEPQGPNEALSPSERGKLVERALQLVWEQLKSSEGLNNPKRAEIVAAAVEQAMTLELPQCGDAWTARFRALERERTIGLVNEWLDHERERPPFHVLRHQVEVEVELAGLRLRGRLDRLDEVGDSHVVIDYKTGAVDSVASWRVARPEKPQLPFYSWALQQQKFDVAGIAFASVRRGECGFRGYLRDPGLLKCPSWARSFGDVPFDDYSALWAVELERIAHGFSQGEAAVDPRIAPGKSKSPCTHCHLQSLCRVQDVAAGEQDEPWGEDHE